MCSNQTVAGRVERLHRVETIAAAEKLRCIAEVDARQTWRAEGARSTADLLVHRLRLTRGEARAQTGTADDRSFGQRQADELPHAAAQRPHVIMITHPDGQARLDGVGPASQQTAQLVGCDAETTCVAMDRNSGVLDAGRTRREPTRRQRAAVIARDQTCAGCGAPAARCHIHHVRWSTKDHAPTDENNPRLTC